MQLIGFFDHIYRKSLMIFRILNLCTYYYYYLLQGKVSCLNDQTGHSFITQVWVSGVNILLKNKIHTMFFLTYTHLVLLHQVRKHDVQTFTYKNIFKLVPRKKCILATFSFTTHQKMVPILNHVDPGIISNS